MWYFNLSGSDNLLLVEAIYAISKKEAHFEFDNAYIWVFQ